MATSITLTRNPIYDDDGSEVLISKSTWPLKLSGILFAGMLVIGRSASYGNITWSPAYHAPSTPLVVVHKEAPNAPAPTVPKSAPSNDPAAMGKRMAAEEVVTFSPGGNSVDGSQGSVHTAQETATETAGEVTGQATASPVSAKTAQETATETAGEVTGQATASPVSAKTAPETATETAGEVTGQATASPVSAKTAQETAAETEGEPTGAAESTAAATTKPGEATTEVAAAPPPSPAPAPAAQVTQLATTGQMPLAAEGALGAVLAVIGIALLKPRNFLRRLIR